MIPFPFTENRFSFFFCCRPSTSRPVVYKSQEWWEPSIMSESDTMFNEWDRKCAAVQLMHSTDPTYDNRTIVSTLKMQQGRVQGDENKVSGDAYSLWCGFKWGPHYATSHLRSWLESQHQRVPGCAEKVWWFTGAIKWPAADPGCGSRTRCRPTSPKRPRLVFRRSATTLYPSLTAPSSPDLNLLDYFVWSYVKNITNMTSRNTKANLIAAIRRVFAEPPPALVEKAISKFRIRIEAVIEAEGGYIE